MYQVESGNFQKTEYLSPGGTVESVLGQVIPDNPASVGQISSLISLCLEDPCSIRQVVEHAARLKETVFGSGVKLFVPVYISNHCINDCHYCGYRRSNAVMNRRTLSVDEFRQEIIKVTGMGYRVIEIVTSESPALTRGNVLADYVSVTKEVLDKVPKSGDTPEIILMSWALSEREFRDVRDAGLDSFYLWQETYNKDLYSMYHPGDTPKSDFEWRLGVFDRATRAGISRLGLGVLLGLDDWKSEVISLIEHGRYIERTYGISPDAIGVPRFKHAEGACLDNPPSEVTDEELKLIVALYRLAFPRTHLFLNTREKFPLIMELLKGGGSEMNIACAVFPGGYSSPRKDRQFDFYNYPTEITLERLKDEGYSTTHFHLGIQA